MRVGIIQSSYIPWRGYFDFIRSVDLFILFDDVPFGAKGSWRNRNQLLFRGDLRWLTVPVNSRLDQPIDEVLIDPHAPQWRQRHKALITESLRGAAHFGDALAVWEEGVEGSRDASISGLNASLTDSICRYLGVRTPIRNARELGVTGTKTKRLIALLEAVNARTYLSGPTAAGYLDEDLFRDRGIRLEFKSYDYPPYPQNGTTFIGTVSVLDLIAHVGSDSGRCLQSRTPDKVVVA